MLILTRRPGERVVIGEDILVTVMEVNGQTVRLGIAAPSELPIYREEIWIAVKDENRAAAQAADGGQLPVPVPAAEPAVGALARQAAGAGEGTVASAGEDTVAGAVPDSAAAAAEGESPVAADTAKDSAQRPS